MPPIEPDVGDGGGGLSASSQGQAFIAARARLGNSVTQQTFNEFADTGNLALTVAGTGTNALSTTARTTNHNQTLAAAGSNAITRLISGGINNLIVNQRTDIWHFMARVRFTSAPAATTSNYIGLSGPSGSCTMGIIGAVSVANFAAQLFNGALTNVDLGVPVNVGWNTFEMWNDGANIHFSINGTEITTRLSTATLGSGRYEHAATNGGGGGNQSTEVDWFSLCYASN